MKYQTLYSLLVISTKLAALVYSTDKFDKGKANKEDGLALVDFNALNAAPSANSNQNTAPKMDSTETEEESFLLKGLEKELQDIEGKIDIGISLSEKDSKILEEVSKDPTSANEYYKFSPHHPQFFKDRSFSEDIQSSVLSTSFPLRHVLKTAVETTLAKATTGYTSPAQTITDHTSIFNAASTSEKQNIQESATISSETQTQTISSALSPEPPTKTFEEGPFLTTSEPEVPSGRFTTSLSTENPAQASTVKTPEPNPRPEVQRPFASVSSTFGNLELFGAKTEVPEPSSPPSPLPHNFPIDNSGEARNEMSESQMEGQSFDLNKMDIRQAVKDSIDKYMKEILDSKPIFSKPGGQNPEVSKTRKNVHVHPTVISTSLIRPTELIGSSTTNPLPPTDFPQANPLVDKNPILTKTVVIHDPQLSARSSSEPLTTLSPAVELPDVGEDLLPNTPSIDPEIKDYINDKLGFSDLNEEKLKKILDTLLKLKGGDESKNLSYDDTAHLSSFESAQYAGQPAAPQYEKLEKSKVGSHNEDLKLQELENDSETHEQEFESQVSETDAEVQEEDSESQELDVLQALGLKEMFEESQSPEKGTILKKLKEIPQNVFDLVDRRYGEENGESKETESGAPNIGRKGSGKSQKAGKEDREGDNERHHGKKSTNDFQEMPVNKKAQNLKLAHRKKNQKPGLDSKGGSDAGLKKHSSLNKILKDKTTSRPSMTEDLPEDEEYKKLNQGKVIFGFDKKKKIGLRKSRLGDSEEEGKKEEGEKNVEEIEYYEPEKYLFDKASIDVTSFNPDSENTADDTINGDTSTHSESIIDQNNEVTNVTKEGYQKLLDNLMNDTDSKSPLKKNNKNNDPYSIPKGPADLLGTLGNAKDSKSVKEGSLTNNTTKPTTSSKGQTDKYKKVPSLLFTEADNNESLFDFTKSEANSIKLMSWSIMGAAILVASSVILV